MFFWPTLTGLPNLKKSPKYPIDLVTLGLLRKINKKYVNQTPFTEDYLSNVFEEKIFLAKIDHTKLAQSNNTWPQES